MEFYKEYADCRGQFEILAVHGKRANTLAELDRRLENIKRDEWGGETLPFPVLLDATGEVLKAWGVQGLPITVLVDPEGRVVRGGIGDLLVKLRRPAQPSSNGNQPRLTQDEIQKLLNR
jgi:hypothetical protein